MTSLLLPHVENKVDSTIYTTITTVNDVILPPGGQVDATWCQLKPQTTLCILR